jgi:hypothetical protein
MNERGVLRPDLAEAFRQAVGWFHLYVRISTPRKKLMSILTGPLCPARSIFS